MPRRPRIEGASLIHHVTGHSSPTRDAFPDDRARRGFLSLLASTVAASGWLVMAYCLLSTHYHLLVQTPEPNLGDGMRRIHGRHAQLLNARRCSVGPLWRDRFHSTVIETDAHVVQAAAYIDGNPVLAGLCTHPADWAWSSYRANAGLAEPSHWHRQDILYTFFGAGSVEAPSVYARAVTAAIERGRLRLRTST